MKKSLIILLIALLTLISFSFFYWFNEVKFFKIKADVSQASFSVDNSYVFVSPLRAQANGQEKVRLTVFILNGQGLGVLGRKVELGNDSNLKIETIQTITDQLGKAIFDISSTKAGEYYLDVSVDDQKLKQQGHLSFN